MTTKRQARREEIARAAIAPLSERGISNVRLADIGESLQMTGAHLLYYFASKTDLFLAVLRAVEQDLRETIHADWERMESGRERWEHLIDTGAPTGLHDSGLMIWLAAWSEAVHDPEVLAVVRDLEGQWQDLVREAVTYAADRGEIDLDMSVDDFVEGCAALLDGITLRVVVGYRPVDKERAVAIFSAFADAHLRWRADVTTGARG